ncbi:MAG: FAD-binding protein [Bacteroidales bacterium]|jgi:FAD/FMN-containing dehydrogenase/Fe-S oxidoreductase|nr:FAD-binding protein [Bacteroidales bacterium]
MKEDAGFDTLRNELEGDLHDDKTWRILYATDASSYRELPLAVTRPKNTDDIKKIIAYAREHNLSVIPRGAGTSLAGQVVGPGIVMDISRYLTRIIEFNPEEKWVIVEPGVVLDELNIFLAPHGLKFGPETSTSNRCCIAGMLGNNSCGAHSLIYGSVRDHILEADVVLSDGSEANFRALDAEEFNRKCDNSVKSLESAIYRNIREILSDPVNRKEIEENFPHPGLKRRNNGYALDSLIQTDPFTGNGIKINLCKLLAGSEGTLAFTTRMKLNLVPVSTRKTGLICAHFSSLQDAVKANILILKHKPAAIEMIDDFILDCTKNNIEQSRNRFFINGKPKIILLIEILRDTVAEIEQTAEAIEQDLRHSGYGYHFPLFTDEEEIKRIWELRKAGLGVLLIIPGEKRSIQVIEDTAVLPDLFPEYIAEFQELLVKHNLSCAYYAHIATGELHLSPLLNLRDEQDVNTYRMLAEDVARLVKKYRGSLSGEHGDGRLRGEFIPLMLGSHNYDLLRRIKKTWDPSNVLNPGKITDAPPMDHDLRYIPGRDPSPMKTAFRFPEKRGYLHAVEMCSGSGDCRKSALIGGTMCPSFMATRDEDKSTRGRANILREFLTRSEKDHAYDHKEIIQVMDLCLSCKACKSECPSNVDMTKLKAEFLQHYYDIHGIPLRSLLVGWLPRLYALAMPFRPVANLLTGTKLFARMIGFTPERKIPELSGISLRRWMSKNKPSEYPNGKVYLFADEFTNYNESDIGIKVILLLQKLGYDVVIPRHIESGRTFLSKGMTRRAASVARRNILMLKEIITEETPLVGIEPSAILTFRDEYRDLDLSCSDMAHELARNTMLLEEFVCREAEKGKILPEQFTSQPARILLHGHCQQKAISGTLSTKKMLSLPSNYRVLEIPSGCCGMAGSFGYEKEHYDLSMKIGEMVLFPAVRSAGSDTIIAASGTSCRHQIMEGTGRKAYHPAEILYDALIRNDNI